MCTPPITARDVLVHRTEDRRHHRPQARACSAAFSSRDAGGAPASGRARDRALPHPNGGKFTDEAEREIERRFLANPGR